jgi:hypothetical protein
MNFQTAWKEHGREVNAGKPDRTTRERGEKTPCKLQAKKHAEKTQTLEEAYSSTHDSGVGCNRIVRSKREVAHAMEIL